MLGFRNGGGIRGSFKQIWFFIIFLLFQKLKTKSLGSAIMLTENFIEGDILADIFRYFSDKTVFRFTLKF